MKTISRKSHTMLDYGSVILLFASPWLFNFNNETYLFHLLMGIVAILAGAFTTKESFKRQYNQQSMAR